MTASEAAKKLLIEDLNRQMSYTDPMIMSDWWDKMGKESLTEYYRKNAKRYVGESTKEGICGS